MAESTEFVYRRIWEIVDQDRPTSALTAEASADLSTALGLLGVRPTRQPRWMVVEDRLVCEVPVLRLDGDERDGGGADCERRFSDAGHPDSERCGQPVTAVAEPAEAGVVG